MSIAGIAASSFFSGAIAQSTQAKFKQAQQEFQQLGQDLEAGNLAQAQTDLAALQKDFPKATGAAPGAAQNDSRRAGPGLQQLSQDLQAGTSRLRDRTLRICGRACSPEQGLRSIPIAIPAMAGMRLRIRMGSLRC
jgi:type II secretory pathway pseudopilin PulG